MKTRIENGTVIAWRDGRHEVIEDGVVVLEGDAIVAVGKRAQVDAMPDAQCEERIDATGRLVMPGWSIVRPTVLVDGFVAATWERKGARVEIRPFRSLTPADRSEVESEAARLIGFVAPDSEPEIVWA